MKNIILIAFIIVGVYCQTVQDSINSVDCTYQSLKNVNFDLMRQWNCFQPTGGNMKFAGDLPNVDWHPDAFPYLQSEFYWAIRKVIEDILYHSNIAEFVNPGMLPRWYFTRGYSALPTSMAGQAYFAKHQCAMSNASVSHPVLSQFEQGAMFSMTQLHPNLLDETTVWTRNVKTNQKFWIYDPNNTYVNMKIAPGFPRRENGSYVLLYTVSNPHANQLASILLQRALSGYGIPYALVNSINNRIPISEARIPAFSGETVVFPRYSRVANLSLYWNLTEGVLKTSTMYLINYVYLNPVVNNTLNVQSFKNYWNVNNPANLIANATNNILDADTQNKVLATPQTGFGFTTCDVPEVACSTKQPMDIIIAIDGSLDIDEADFVSEVQFASNVVDMLPVGAGTVRIGAVVYSSNTTSFELLPLTNAEDIKGKIKNLGKGNGNANVKSGFDAVKNIYGNSNAAVRGKGIPKIVVLVTGSKDSSADLHDVVDQVHALGVNVAVIGVGGNVDADDELQYWATDPRTRNVIKMGNFNLSTIVHKVLTETCKLPAKLGNNTTTVSTAVYPSTSVNFEYLTVSEQYSLLVQTDGRILVYMQYAPAESVPSEFEYDLKIDCVSQCEIPIPPLPFQWYDMRRGPKETTPGKRVVVSMKFMSTNARTDLPINATMSMKAYDANALAPKTESTTTFVPATAEQLEAADAAFTNDFYEFIPHEETDNQNDNVNDNAEPAGSSNLAVIIGSVAGVACIAGAVAIILRNKTPVSLETSPRLDRVVTTEEIKEPRQSAIKRSASRMISEAAK